MNSKLIRVLIALVTVTGMGLIVTKAQYLRSKVEVKPVQETTQPKLKTYPAIVKE